MLYNISDIQKVWPNWYQEVSELSYDDQKFLWENTPLPEEDERRLKEITDNTEKLNVIVNGSVNGACKLNKNFEQNLGKNESISKLKICNYRTPPKEIALYLENIFDVWEEKPLHWLYIAQYYTPKTINSVLNEMIRTHERGAIPFKIPGAYFTYIIKRKKKRKIFRISNSGYKQQ